jgi:hypothetical protein
MVEKLEIPVPIVPQQLKTAETVRPVPDAVITFICAPDYGSSYHSKYVDKFTEL